MAMTYLKKISIKVSLHCRRIHTDSFQPLCRGQEKLRASVHEGQDINRKLRTAPQLLDSAGNEIESLYADGAVAFSPIWIVWLNDIAS